MKRLYYFTDSYPFSVDYTWKSAEIKHAAKKFSEVIIVPFTYKKANDFSFPMNVRVIEPTLGKTLYAKPRYLKYFFSKSQPQAWFVEFFKALKKGKKALVQFYLATVYSDLIVQKDIINELRNLKEKDNTVLFFQWTMNNALLIPFLRKSGFKNIISRMHGFDLYECRHEGYVPYKSKILANTKVCTFISEHGKRYAQSLYPFVKNKSTVHYLGSHGVEQNLLVENQIFHILSISRAVPLKRLHLIADAVNRLEIAVKWTHIGDGPELQDVKLKSERIVEKKGNIEVEFLGWLTPEAIKSYFSQCGINALILVSETEGLPVVIMEAFSASIPVIATDVGGVSELVNSKNGVLLKSNPKADEITNALTFLAKESKISCDTRRNEANKSYKNSFELEENSKKFIDFLIAQCH